MASKESFTFFWKSGSPFSQWYPATFTVDAITYTSAEQFMMHQKAVLFGDDEIADKVLKSDSPRKQKALGRKVNNFDGDSWNKECKSIVKRGNVAKFSQNKNLKKHLLSTMGTTLAEASPVDCIWGIGYEGHHPNAQSRSTWRGTNYLGDILTQVRDELSNEAKIT